jgi:hypothetical protein|tara:strand:+ start:68 stop:535 length:468 start_codon:yes stop_codon:yes gene_type:complete
MKKIVICLLLSILASNANAEHYLNFLNEGKQETVWEFKKKLENIVEYDRTGLHPEEKLTYYDFITKYKSTSIEEKNKLAFRYISQYFQYGNIAIEKYSLNNEKIFMLSFGDNQRNSQIKKQLFSGINSELEFESFHKYLKKINLKKTLKVMKSLF